MAFASPLAAHPADEPPRMVWRPNWAYVVPGIVATAAGVGASTAFAVFFADDARTDFNPDHYVKGATLPSRVDTIVLGISGIGHLTAGIPLLVRGLIGERVAASAILAKLPRQPTRPGRHVRWGMVAPGLVISGLGVAMGGAAIAISGNAFECEFLEQRERDMCRYENFEEGFYRLTFTMLMASAAGHLGVGIPLVVKGAIGEHRDASGLPVLAIQPLVGPGIVGVHGTF